jgi:hypothetical protein
MIGRTLSRFAVIALLALAACDSSDTGSVVADAPGPDPGGWRLSSGKPPTKAEFAALDATCQAKGGTMETCLTELGLKRAP